MHSSVALIDATKTMYYPKNARAEACNLHEIFNLKM